MSFSAYGAAVAAAMRRVVAAVFALLLATSAYGAVAPVRWNLHLWQRLRTAHREAPQTSIDTFFRTVTPYIPAQGTLCLLQTASARRDEVARIHYALQYALAPRLIVLSTDCEFVILYGPTSSASSIATDPSFHLVQVFADDLRLFRRLNR